MEAWKNLVFPTEGVTWRLGSYDAKFKGNPLPICLTGAVTTI